jgi:ribulose-5-phosphate 4-epimerase/fuculose-1-phosphate aldolase
MPSEEESTATRAALQTASTPPPTSLFSSLITANHILHYHEVVDAYGHISVRNPQNPKTFFLSRSLAPALVSNREDLEEYYVEDASPVKEGNGPKGYAERYIHSELYKKYKGVKSVVHSHSEAVIPFGISSVPLRPVFHMVRSYQTIALWKDILTLHQRVG